MNKSQIKEKIILKAHNITKDFPGVRALDNVNLDLKVGEIHALVGENGAGKSILGKIIASIDLKAGEAVFVDYD